MAVRKISTKLAIEGEAEYKQAIASCNTELRTLKSSLALVESEFKGNANSMEALTAKGNALEKMHEAQAKKVDTLKEALANAEKAQSAYSDRVSTAQSNIEKYEKALADLAKTDGDTTEEQARLTAELDKWKNELSDAQAGEEAASRGVQEWQRQLNNAQVDLNNLDGEITKNNQYLNEAKNSADGCATSIDKFGKETKKAGDDSKEAFNQLAAALAAAGIAKTVKEIADVLMECSAAAASFETSIAKVSTLADTSAVPLETLKGELISLSSETGVAVGALAEATYQALSAGVETANVVDFVATATKLSAAGFTESATAVDVLTTAINAYHLEGTEAERVASILVKTQDEGKTSVDELAASMGRVIPSASAYNVNLENLATSYALLTKSGTNTKIATTELSAMLDELASNSSDVAGIIEEETGKSFTDLMGEGKNLGDILQILAGSVDGDATAFSNLWSSSTAGKAALSLLNSGAEEFDATLAKMQTSSGAVDRNFKIMADTTEFAQQRMTTATENLKIAIGDQLNPALEKLYTLGGDAFTWATDFVKENPWIVNAVVGLTAAIAALVLGVGALAAAPAIIGAVNAALALLAANPVVAVTAAVVGLGVAIASWITTSKEADEETKEFKKSLEDTKAAYEELSSTMEEQHKATEATADALKNLLEIENKSESQKQQIADMVDRLNESVPELGLAYNKEADSINMTTESLDALLDRSAKQEEYNTQQERLAELRIEAAELTNRLAEAENELNEARETGSGNTKTLQNNIEELNAALEENETQIQALEEASREWGEAQAAAKQKTAEMTSRVEGLIAEMEALEKEYAEAYQAAYDNINGQIGLFQEMDGSAKSSIEDLIGALQSQVDYMSTYADNIQKAMELGVDEGLVKKLSDGSEESAQILAAIVEGGEDQIAALNEEFTKVEEGKENFSTTIAEMETDFSEKMEAVVRDLDRAIRDMDVADDAYIIGEDNIQGLIDGTASKRAELVSKYAEMGRAALNAYKREVEQASPSKKFKKTGRFDIQGIIEGAEAEKENLSDTYADIARTALESMDKALPSSIVEPSASAISDRQTAAIVSAVAAGGGGGPTYQFHIDEMTVRDDQDVERVAEELYRLTEQAKRSRGGGTL